MIEDINPLLVAMIGAAVTFIGVYVNNRRQDKKDSMGSKIELQKITVEATVQKDQLVDQAVRDMFDRLSEEIKTYRKEVSDLHDRVKHLEDIERKMLAWMAMNDLRWPPPQEVWDSI